MAHFAKIGINNLVEDIVFVDNAITAESNLASGYVPMTKASGDATDYYNAVGDVSILKAIASAVRGSPVIKAISPKNSPTPNRLSSVLLPSV